MRRRGRIGLIGAAAWLSVVCGCGHMQPLSNAYSSVAAAPGERCAFGSLHEDGTCDVYEVSLAELFVVPEKFHRKRVRVGGYATLAFEHNVLCERPDEASSCLWLDIEHLRDPGFRSGWATVEGVFSAENRGHFGCCAGTIEANVVKKVR